MSLGLAVNEIASSIWLSPGALPGVWDAISAAVVATGLLAWFFKVKRRAVR